MLKRLLRGGGALSAAATLLFSGLYRIGGQALFLTLAITCGTLCYHLCMRLLVGFAVDRVMDNRADPTAFWFRPRPWEGPLYRLLRVKNWKGRMPTYVPELFSPKLHSFSEIAQAMCQAEIVHELIVLLSFLPLLLAIPFGALPVFVITSLLAAAFDGMLVMLQRYNRPRILKLANRQEGKPL